MSEFNIWSEGFLDQGMEGIPAPASKLNRDPIEAGSFDDAVRIHMASLPAEPEYPGGPTPASYYDRSPDGVWHVWGCRLWPDEASARKTIFK